MKRKPVIVWSEKTHKHSIKKCERVRMLSGEQRTENRSVSVHHTNNRLCSKWLMKNYDGLMECNLFFPYFHHNEHSVKDFFVNSFSCTYIRSFSAQLMDRFVSLSLSLHLPSNVHIHWVFFAHSLFFSFSLPLPRWQLMFGDDVLLIVSFKYIVYLSMDYNVWMRERCSCGIICINSIRCFSMWLRTRAVGTKHFNHQINRQGVCVCVSVWACACLHADFCLLMKYVIRN